MQLPFSFSEHLVRVAQRAVSTWRARANQLGASRAARAVQEAVSPGAPASNFGQYARALRYAFPVCARPIGVLRIARAQLPRAPADAATA